MNVEVEVVEETRTTYLVQGVRSLEEGERTALAHQHSDKRVTKQGRARKDAFVLFSTPVIVRNDKIIREDR